MHILVTGSSGHLGEAICLVLQQKGIPYTGVDVLEGRCTTRSGSIADRKFVEGLVQGVDYILHTATLHKPHVATHSKQDFIDTNITGTLNLLEEGKRAGVKGLIFTSTTSTFGDVMKPAKGAPAVWVTESLMPLPKNIYGVTKLAAEKLCWLFYRNHQFPSMVLRTARFFWEADDKPALRDQYADLNIKANAYLHRRVDLEDIVAAHLLALDKLEVLGFDTYILSATSPFTEADLPMLNTDAPEVVGNLFPEYKTIYEAKGWKMFPRIGRVYVNDKARRELGWEPKYDFKFVLEALATDKPFRSPLSMEVGIKPYHTESFADGPYPVEEND